MTMKPNLDAIFEQEESESKLVIEAGSQAVLPKMSATVTGKVMTPIPMNPADMAKMISLGKQKFAVYQTLVDDLVHQAQTMVVDSEHSHIAMSELGLRSKKLGKEIKEKREGFTKHASEFVKGLESFCNPFTVGCKKVEQISKDKNRDYLAILELERRKQKKIIFDAQKEVQTRVDAEAKAAGVESVQIQPPVVREEQKTVTRTAEGTVYLSKKKDWKLLNISLVPREMIERVIMKDPEKLLGPIIHDEIKRNPEVEIEGILIFDSADVKYRT